MSAHQEAIDRLIADTGMGELQAHRHLQARKILQERQSRAKARRRMGLEPEN